MLRFKARLFSLKLESGFTKRMDSAIQILIRQAARAWLRAVIIRVPVWSGESLGSIKYARGPNGTLGRYLNIAIPIVPIKERKNKNQDTGGRQGRYSFTTGQGRHIYGFYFRSDVPQFVHNEFYPRSDRGAGGQQIVAPWRSLEAGKLAFEEAINSGIKKLPKIQDSILKIQIPIGS